MPSSTTSMKASVGGSSQGKKSRSPSHMSKVKPANDDNYLSFGKYLADSEKKVRDAAVESLEAYLSQTRHDMSTLDILKLCKGLFYCFWMSDKPLIQQELAKRLASFILAFKKTSLSVLYIQGFWDMIIREWYKVDRIRLDKFYNLLRQFHYHTFLWLESQNWDMNMVDAVMNIHEERILSVCNGGDINVPESLRYHTVETFFSELNKVIENGDIVVNNDPSSEGANKSCSALVSNSLVMDRLQQPFLLFLSKSHNELLIQRVFDLLESLTEPLEDPDVNTSSDGEDEEDEESEDIKPPRRMLDSVLDIQELAGKVIAILEQPDALKKNKKLIIDFCKEWCAVLGIDFQPPKDLIKLPKTLYGDFDILKEEDDHSRKRSRSELDEEEEQEDEDIATLVESNEIDTDSFGLDETMDSNEDDSFLLSAVEQSEEEAVSVAKTPEKRKKKNKKNKTAKTVECTSAQEEMKVKEDIQTETNEEALSEIPHALQENAQDDIAPEEDTVVANQVVPEEQVESTDSPASKKSVRWETKLRVKSKNVFSGFFKRKPIGDKVNPMENAKSLEPHLKPVLKKIDYKIPIKMSLNQKRKKRKQQKKKAAA